MAVNNKDTYYDINVRFVHSVSEFLFKTNFRESTPVRIKLSVPEKRLTICVFHCITFDNFSKKILMKKYLIRKHLQRNVT